MAKRSKVLLPVIDRLPINTAHFGYGDPRAGEPTTRPRYAFLVAVLVAAAWFCNAPYWQSDDFIALSYASHPRQALADFGGNQFGLPGMVWFYRPLVTLSWVFDAVVGGADPFLAHFGNAIAHGLCAMMLVILLQRFMALGVAVFAGLVFGLAASHAGAVFWAAGRTGVHCTFWILLSLWCLCLCLDRDSFLWQCLALLAAGLAFLTKETACALPALAALLAFCRAEPGERLRRTIVAAWPFFAMLAIYFAARFLMFERLVGGYGSLPSDWAAAGKGLGEWLLRVVNPLWRHDFARQAEVLPWLQSGLPDWLAYLGFLPALLGAFLMLLQRRGAMLLALLLAIVICTLPVMTFWSNPNSKDLRLFYLAMAPISALLAAGGWRTGLLALVIALGPFLLIRKDYFETWAKTQQMHQQLITAIDGHADDLHFVAGLDRENQHANSLMFHLGVDRLLAPPFTPTTRRVFALRPLQRQGAPLLLPYGEDRRLPFGATWFFTKSRTGLGMPATAAPPGSLDVIYEGAPVIDAALLGRLGELRQGRGDPSETPRFRIRSFRAPAYRVTVFGAGGYASVMVNDEAGSNSMDGAFTMLGLGNAVAFLLREVAVLDSNLVLPMLVEARDPHAALSPGGIFDPTHCNHRPVFVTLGRDYARAFE